jgi:hypothetical protein
MAVTVDRVAPVAHLPLVLGVLLQQLLVRQSKFP